jgi:hypothetical protein
MRENRKKLGLRLPGGGLFFLDCRRILEYNYHDEMWTFDHF